MCIYFHRDRRSLRGSIGQICQNSPIHGICHWLSRAGAVTGWETKLSWARAVAGWETTLGRAWPVTGWETTRPLLFKGHCHWYPIIRNGSGGYGTLFFQNRHLMSCPGYRTLFQQCDVATGTGTVTVPCYYNQPGSNWILWYLFQLNVDRFYAQCHFFFFYRENRYFTWYRDERNIWIKLKALMTRGFSCCTPAFGTQP